MPLAIGIEPYSMDCLNESYSKSEQNLISQAMFLFYSLMALWNFTACLWPIVRTYLSPSPSTTLPWTPIARLLPSLCPFSLSLFLLLFILLLLSSSSPILPQLPHHPPPLLSSHRSLLCLAVSQCCAPISHHLSTLQNPFFSSSSLYLYPPSISSLSSLSPLTFSPWVRAVK